MRHKCRTKYKTAEEAKEAQRQKTKEWKAAHPERVREINRMYHYRHKERINEYDMNYYEKHRDEILKRNKEIYESKYHGEDEEANMANILARRKYYRDLYRENEYYRERMKKKNRERYARRKKEAQNGIAKAS